MGKKFNQFLRNAAKLGINVGDINQASAIFTGQDPNAAATPLPDPPTPPQIQQLQAPLELSSDNRSRLSSGTRSRRRRASQRRGQRRLTTGLNTGGTGSSGGISF
jgi:hypothetical protein